MVSNFWQWTSPWQLRCIFFHIQLLKAAGAAPGGGNDDAEGSEAITPAIMAVREALGEDGVALFHVLVELVLKEDSAYWNCQCEANVCDHNELSVVTYQISPGSTLISMKNF